MIADNMRQFAEAEIATFPILPIMPDGSCGCGDIKCKNAGKHPASTNWQHTPIPDDDALEVMQASGQLDSGYGVLLSGSNLLVVDVDPRNDGEPSFAKLVKEIPALAGAGLIVETGRRDGGRHYYFRLPADTSLVQSLAGYKGIDFKSSGYVVGPGSLHEAGHRYRILHGSPFDIEDAPAELLKLLKRATNTTTGTKSTNVDPDDLARLVALIPNDDADYDAVFIRVGMAIHECGGDFPLWDTWAAQSSKYNEREMAKKWRSFGKGKTRCRLGTLLHLAQKAGNDVSALRSKYREAEEQVEPVDIFGTFEPPPFDCSLLPEQLAIVAEDQGRLIGCDPGIVAMTGLAVLAGAIDDRIQIQPKRHDPTWTESARLWVVIEGDPSTKKSPGQAKAVAPIKAAAAKKREQYQRELKKWNDECDKLKKGDKKPPPPQLQRLTVSDTTIEKLSDILGGAGAAPRGILAIYDELSGHLSSMDCYRNGAGGKDRAKWLESYQGGSVEVDRVNKGSTFVENWSVSIVGGIQPTVIHAYANATNHDGMLQRFLIYQARRACAGVDEYPNMRAKQAYADLVEELVELAPDDAPVKLSEPAHAIREQYAAIVLKAAQNMPNKPLAAMLGKWEATYARLLLIWHVVECRGLSRYPNTVPVSAENAQKVADLLLKVLLPHAIRFYEGLDPTEDEARSIAGLILARKWSRFTVKRDLMANAVHFRTKLKQWQRDELLDRLEAYGWIFAEPDKLNERGRPVAYTVNQRVHELFADHAERERERRAEVAEMLNDMKRQKVADVARARVEKKEN